MANSSTRAFIAGLLGAVVGVSCVMGSRIHDGHPGEVTHAALPRSKPAMFAARPDPETIAHQPAHTPEESVAATAAAATPEADPATAAPHGVPSALSNHFSAALATTDPELRSVASHYASVCHRRAEQLSRSEVGAREDEGGAERTSAAQELDAFCAGADSGLFTLRLRDTPGAGGNIYRELTRTNRFKPSQEGFQSAVTTLANPAKYPAHVNMWLMRFVYENATLVQDAGPGGRLVIVLQVLESLVADEEFLSVRRLDACVLHRICPSDRERLRRRHPDLASVSTALASAISRQEWAAVYTLVHASNP